jgi:hypothetical protein
MSIVFDQLKICPNSNIFASIKIVIPSQFEGRVEFYGDVRIFADGSAPSLRLKLSNLSEFMRGIKVNFARFYNRSHNRGVTFGATASDIIRTILQMRASSDQRSLYLPMTSGLRIYSNQSTKRSLNRSRAWMEFIR